MFHFCHFGKLDNTDPTTFTFCDSGENHAGMEQLGNMVAEGEGFTKEDLDNVKKYFSKVEIIETVNSKHPRLRIACYNIIK